MNKPRTAFVTAEIGEINNEIEKDEVCEEARSSLLEASINILFIYYL